MLFILLACRSKKVTDPAIDAHDKGTINISADESFKPVIDAQVQVYEADYPDVKLNVHYKPEADCLNDLTVDSVRMIIVTRRISEEEKAFIEDSLKVSPDQMMMAYDAIAVIVHPDEEIRRFTMNEIREILQGKFRKNLIPVFDGLKATSTVRFIVDSVLHGDSLTRNSTMSVTGGASCAWESGPNNKRASQEITTIARRKGTRGRHIVSKCGRRTSARVNTAQGVDGWKAEFLDDSLR